MKYYVRSNQYRASNVYFNVSTKEAFSYNWWKFFAVIDGKNVFNRYGYSVSTSRHQSKVRSLLEELGIEIEIELEAPKGLQELDFALEYMQKRLAFYELKEKRSRKYAHIWFEDVQRTKIGIAFLLMNQAKRKAA